MTARSTSQKKLWLRQCPRLNSLSRYLAIFNFPFQKKKTTKTKKKLLRQVPWFAWHTGYNPGEGRWWETICFIGNCPKNKTLWLHNKSTMNYWIQLFYEIQKYNHGWQEFYRLNLGLKAWHQRHRYSLSLKLEPSLGYGRNSLWDLEKGVSLLQYLSNDNN